MVILVRDGLTFVLGRENVKLRAIIPPCRKIRICPEKKSANYKSAAVTTHGDSTT